MLYFINKYKSIITHPITARPKLTTTSQIATTCLLGPLLWGHNSGTDIMAVFDILLFKPTSEHNLTWPYLTN